MWDYKDDCDDDNDDCDGDDYNDDCDNDDYDDDDDDDIMKMIICVTPHLTTILLLMKCIFISLQKRCLKDMICIKLWKLVFVLLYNILSLLTIIFMISNTIQIIISWTTHSMIPTALPMISTALSMIPTALSMIPTALFFLPLLTVAID